MAASCTIQQSRHSVGRHVNAEHNVAFRISTLGRRLGAQKGRHPFSRGRRRPQPAKYRAQDSISALRFSNKSLRAYAASALSLILWARAASMTA